MLSDPEVVSDTKRFMELSREEANTRETVIAYREYKQVIQNISDAEEMIKEASGDADLEEMAKEELKKLYKDVNYDINVKVIRWDSSAVILRCYVWEKDISESFENSCKLNENLKKVFDKNYIGIPYNYINVINKK